MDPFRGIGWGKIMLKKILLLSLVLLGGVFVVSRHVKQKALDKDSAEIATATRELEEIKKNIDYCLANIGKKYSTLDEKQAGGFWPQEGLGVMTYALVAYKLGRYGDVGKSADYFYLNWLHYNTPQTDETRWPYPDGEYDDFYVLAIERWEVAGKYSDIVEHYEEYIAHMYSPLKTGTIEEQLKYMKEAMPSWGADMRRSYEHSIQNLDKYKKIAATSKPTPLTPAVQNHEWFYSDKPGEVLKALDYYYKYKVRFMLEKALNNKFPVVSKKAKEYLEKLDKEGGR